MILRRRFGARLTRAAFPALYCATALAGSGPPSVERAAEPLPVPLTLSAALTYALAHNPALRRTREQIREEEGVLIEARAAERPSVIASGGYTRLDDRLVNPLFGSPDLWSVDLTAQHLLYSGGGVQAQVRGQREVLESAKLAFTAALNDTRLDVTQQFYDVLLARELIGVQEEAIRVLEAALGNAGNRRQAGTGSDFDVLRAEVAVANAKPALIRVRNAYRVTQDRLRTTLGAPAAPLATETDLRVEGRLAVPRQAIALADAISAARAQRPELLRQERLSTAADEAVAGSRSGARPTVRAVAGYELSNPLPGSQSGRAVYGWTAGVQAQWAIFDGRATTARVAQARSRAAQARLTGEELTLAIDLEVRQAHSALVESNELLVASERVIEQARESVRLANARLQAGTATQLDLLEAQSALTLAQSNFAQAEHDYAVGLAALERATGRPLD